MGEGGAEHRSTDPAAENVDWVPVISQKSTNGGQRHISIFFKVTAGGRDPANGKVKTETKDKRHNVANRQI